MMTWKARARKAISAVAVMYALVFLIYNYALPSGYRECKSYTREMKGGFKLFDGKYYEIVLCGTFGSIASWKNHDDNVRLQVFSAEGELLAQRFFNPIVGFGKEGYQLSYGRYYLSYDISTKGGAGVETVEMTMPPSRWDWIRARLPRFVFW